MRRVRYVAGAACRVTRALSEHVTEVRTSPEEAHSIATQETKTMRRDNDRMYNICTYVGTKHFSCHLLEMSLDKGTSLFS